MRCCQRWPDRRLSGSTKTSRSGAIFFMPWMRASVSGRMCRPGAAPACSAMALALRERASVKTWCRNWRTDVDVSIVASSGTLHPQCILRRAYTPVDGRGGQLCAHTDNGFASACTGSGGASGHGAVQLAKAERKVQRVATAAIRARPGSAQPASRSGRYKRPLHLQLEAAAAVARPPTLACMHGSAWAGDGAGLLRRLGSALAG